MAQSYSAQDLRIGQETVQRLHGLAGYDAWAELIAKVIAAERERNAACLEAHADLLTNSLHCGDNSMTIHQAHRESDALVRAANWIRGA